MGFEDPKVRGYYWIDLASGLLLNVAMIAAGIGLVRRKRWGITLGIGTAVAKIVRLVLITGYFTLAVAPVFAQKNAEMVGRMMVQQRSMGQAEPPAIDVSPLVQVNTRMYVAIAVALLLLGSIYPAVSLWVLARPGVPSADVESKGSRDQEWNATW